MIKLLSAQYLWPCLANACTEQSSVLLILEVIKSDDVIKSKKNLYKKIEKVLYCSKFFYLNNNKKLLM